MTCLGITGESHSEFGVDLLQAIYDNSPTLEPKFVVLTEKKAPVNKKKLK